MTLVPPGWTEESDRCLESTSAIRARISLADGRARCVFPRTEIRNRCVENTTPNPSGSTPPSHDVDRIRPLPFRRQPSICVAPGRRRRAARPPLRRRPKQGLACDDVGLWSIHHGVPPACRVPSRDQQARLVPGRALRPAGNAIDNTPTRRPRIRARKTGTRDTSGRNPKVWAATPRFQRRPSQCPSNRRFHDRCRYRRPRRSAREKRLGARHR